MTNKIIEVKFVDELLILKDLEATYVIKNDLDFNGRYMTPIGSKEKPFKGQIIGNGHKLSNINLRCNTSNDVALIISNEGTIKDLIIENLKVDANINRNSYLAPLCAYNYGEILNVDIEGGYIFASINSGNTYSGVVAYNEGTITNTRSNIPFNYYVNNGKLYFGGLVSITKKGHIETLENNGRVIINGNEKNVKAFMYLYQGSNTNMICNVFGSPLATVNSKLFKKLYGTKKDLNCNSNLYRDNFNDDSFLSQSAMQTRLKIEKNMREQGSVEWTPDKTLIHECTCKAKVHYQKFEKGVTYYGIPYSHKAGSLQRFKYAFNEDGTLKPFIKPNGYDGFDMYMGNDCSSAVYWALNTVSSDVDYHWTWDGHPSFNLGTLPLGNYKFTYSENTGEVIAENGKQKMAECFALLNVGSPMVHIKNASGHFRINAKNPTIYRNDKGDIDLMKSYCTTHEQGDGLLPINKGKSRSKSWILDGTYSIQHLFKEEFIPLTTNALINEKPDEIKISYTGNTKKEINKGTIKTNYRIISVKASILDNDETKWTETLFTGVHAYEGHGNRKEIMPIINKQKMHTLPIGHETRLKKEYNARITTKEFDLDVFNHYLNKDLLVKNKEYTYVVETLLASEDVIKVCEIKFKG